jgi:choline dehydrogenase
VQRYDVVVLGGGTAGCALAARLSENETRTVCLVEAGPDYGPFGADRWPAEMLDARHIPRTHDWPAASSERGTSRARIIGGCSAHNACLVIRGTPADYDEWGAGWSYDELAPHLDRAERELRTQPAIADDAPPWHAAAIEAARGLGLRAGPYRANAVDGVRWNTAFAYLDVARPRSNLTIRAETVVDRLVLTDGRAAAAVLHGGGEVAADVFVLASGAYGSPSVLLRSGVGPGLDLDLPVGQNLIDHVGVNVVWRPAVDVAPRDGQASYALIEPEDLHLLPGTYLGDDGAYVASIIGFFMKPVSTGELALRGPDAGLPPLIRHAHLADERDVERVVRAVELARRIGAAEPCATLVEEELEPGEVDLERHVRANARGYYHPVGTCAIGGVVDERLRVRGVENVYVVDASVMPTIPRANTNLTTVAIAERASEWV